MDILVIGGSGGIGQALLHCFHTHYPNARLHATYYQHFPSDMPHICWYPLDVTDEQQIIAFSKQFESLTILVNAVGFLHAPSAQPEKSLQQFNAAFFQQNILLNTLPSILLAQHLAHALKRAAGSTFFIGLSARIGSIADNQKGGWISYRAAKAALNMALKTISIEWQTKLPHCCVLAFHPGTTDTALSKPFQKNLPAGQLHSAQYTAEALYQVLQQKSSADSGSFVSFDGSIIPW